MGLEPNFAAGSNPFLGSLSFNRLASSVARDFDVTLDDILGGRRFQNCVHARAVICQLCLDKGWSKSEIGRRLERDHTTVIHASRRFDTYLQHYPLVAESYAKHIQLDDLAQKKMAEARL